MSFRTDFRASERRRPSPEVRAAALARRKSMAADTREFLSVPVNHGALHRRGSISNSPVPSMSSSNGSGNVTIGQSATSVLHRIPDLKVPSMKVEEEYDVEKTISEGCFAKVYLTTHRPTNSTIVLKAVHAELMTYKEFLKEYHYTYQLSHHPNIIKCYQVVFQTDDYYLFAMEHAPFGDLSGHVGPRGIPESFCKSIATQISSALGFMHFKNLVHRDVKLENILVFAPDFSRVKLCDFGATTREGTLVHKIRHTWTSFLAPEVLEVVKNERFICKTTSDSWQFGVMLYNCLTGQAPWRAADWGKDPSYSAFVKYQKKKTTTVPEIFKNFTTRLIRAFRKILDPEPENRAKVTEIMKYMKNKWLNTKMVHSKSVGNLNLEDLDQDSICIYVRDTRGAPPVITEDTPTRQTTRTRRLQSTVLGVDMREQESAVAQSRVLEWVQNCDQTQADSDIEKF